MVIMSSDLIKDIQNINDYFDYLQKVKKQYLIVISVRDTVGFCMNDKIDEHIKNLGLNEKLKGKHGHSYVAIIEKGNVRLERLSVRDETQIFENIPVAYGTVEISVMSSVFHKGNPFSFYCIYRFFYKSVKSLRFYPIIVGYKNSSPHSVSIP